MRPSVARIGSGGVSESPMPGRRSIRRRLHPNPPTPISSSAMPRQRTRSSGSAGSSAGSGCSRSASQRISAHPVRAGSSSYIATGALRGPVQRTSSSLSAPAVCATRVNGIPLAWKIPFAASPQGPGTPVVSTSRSPGSARARSTSTYSAFNRGHLPAHRVSLYRLMSAISRAPEADALAHRYQAVRAASLALAEPLSAEDCALQSMPDASPVKWHLAHTTWYFETFALESGLPGYRCFEPAFRVLFNSYYNGVGPQYARPQRGLLTRPSLEEVIAYREHVDRHMLALLEKSHDAALGEIVLLGTHHEQQHQELILTDVKHLLAQNPLGPVYRESGPHPAAANAGDTTFAVFPGGVREIGYADAEGGFAFDNEGPRHRVF